MKNKRRVLIIEGDPWLADLYRVTLESKFEVGVAGDVPEAIDAIEVKAPEAIVLDLTLPEYNGVALLHELRSHPYYSKIPVILHSAIHPERCALNRNQWHQYGVVDYVYKMDSSMQTLVVAVERLF
ncbi:MAG TPA: response regulator [Candidatus Saccharimonadales bacterium]|nr:response regulator [Candidatus Saccharimonadales bacterium]